MFGTGAKVTIGIRPGHTVKGVIEAVPNHQHKLFTVRVTVKTDKAYPLGTRITAKKFHLTPRTR